MIKKIAIAAILVALAAVGYMRYSAQHAGQGNAGKKPSVLVSVGAVTQSDVPVELDAVGSVVPMQTVAVRARLDSQIVEVRVHPGDYVNAGDLLFRLDGRALRAQLDEQQSNLLRDQAQDKNLQLQYQRKKTLSARGYETQENLEMAKAAAEAQRATVGATAAAIENLKVLLQYAEITAPISGRVGTIAQTVGNTVKANDTLPLAVINQVKPIWVQASLPQRYIDDVRQAKVAGDVLATAQHEKGKAVDGALDYIDNAVDSTTGTFAVRAVFPNDDESLWPGMFVNVTLRVGERKGVLAIPEVALQHGPAGDFVYTVKDGTAHKQPVKVDFIHGGTAVIAEGVTSGEQVVTDGVLKLEDGAAVAIAP